MNKPHIGIFGRRNHGKSSLINALSGQDVSIVSDIAGTTTDPVKKQMEIHGIGPVVIIDTAGNDDEGELGEKRVNKTISVIKTVDLAILVVAHNKFGVQEIQIIDELTKFDVPFIVVYNKVDVELPTDDFISKLKENTHSKVINFSCKERDKYIEPLILLLKDVVPESAYQRKTILGDLVKQGDLILMITPIDIEAPEGRLILPQVQTIRDALDNDCAVIVVKERELDGLLRKLEPKPALAVTDSQVFLKVGASVPQDIPLTSFSILLARLKGEFNAYLKGTPAISTLNSGDRILLLESCTHHVSCDDIGRVKIPRWISQFTGKQLHYDVVAGLDELQRPMTDYSMVIQCGGCMVTQKQLVSRLKPAIEAGIPVSNYGMTIAYVQGIFDRAVKPFKIDMDLTQTYI